MKKGFTFLITLLSYITVFAQTIGTKVSFTAVDGKTYTGIVKEIQGNSYKIKYDGFDFESWLLNTQFSIVNPPTIATYNQGTETNNRIGSKVSIVATDGKTYTGFIKEINGDKYKIKYDGHDFEPWLLKTQFSVVNNTEITTYTPPLQQPPGKSTSDGKVYFRTFMWTSQYGSSLELKWIFLGNDGTIVINPDNGVNPINYTAELKNNADNVGKYKIAGNKIFISWQKGKASEWSLEFKNGEISAMDGGIVTRPKAMPANYKLSGQYAASAVFPNVSSVHTLVFSNDGTFTLNKSGAISAKDVSALSKTDSKGTYKISGNTLWLNFDNGHTEISTIYIWEQGGGKRHLVIDQSSYPQEG